MKITKEIANKFDISYSNLRHAVKDPNAKITTQFALALAMSNAPQMVGISASKYFVCESFYSAMEKAKDSLFKLKTLFDVEPHHARYLINGILYAISHEGNSICMCKIANKIPIASHIIASEREKDLLESNSDISEFDDLIGVLLFKQFAETETVFVKAGNTEVLNENRYKNQSKSDITILDSKWFRNIVRVEGFSVSGHFRFQLFGKGRNQKKLIWIDEFQKNGYSRTVCTKVQAPEQQAEDRPL